MLSYGIGKDDSVFVAILVQQPQISFLRSTIPGLNTKDIFLQVCSLFFPFYPFASVNFSHLPIPKNGEKVAAKNKRAQTTFQLENWPSPSSHISYLKQVSPQITEQVEKVEREPAQAIQDGYGHQHHGGSPCPLHIFGHSVVPHNSVLLEEEVEAPIHHTDDKRGKDVLEENGED